MFIFTINEIVEMHEHLGHKVIVKPRVEDGHTDVYVTAYDHGNSFFQTDYYYKFVGGIIVKYVDYTV